MNWGVNSLDSSFSISIIDINNITRYKITLNYNELLYNPVEQQLGDNKCMETISSRFKNLNEYFSYYFYKENRIYLALYIFFFFIGLTILLLIILSITCCYKIYKRIKNYFYYNKLKHN
jgi:hypothetical protein